MNNYVRNTRDAAGTQENLNPQDNQFPILLRTNETLLIEEGPTICRQQGVSASPDGFILDSGVKGILGEDRLGVLTSDNTIVQVSSPSDIFIERFAFEQLKGDNNTATWDTTDKQVEFASGQVLEIKHAFLDNNTTGTVKNIVSATLTVEVLDGIFSYEMSANGGASWENVTLGLQHEFASTGKDLWIKITEIGGVGQYFPYTFPITFGTSGGTGTIKSLRCRYNTTIVVTPTGNFFPYTFPRTF